jgi:hypothetical protein
MINYWDCRVASLLAMTFFIDLELSRLHILGPCPLPPHQERGKLRIAVAGYGMQGFGIRRIRMLQRIVAKKLVNAA